MSTFYRKKLTALSNWRSQSNRKPLIIRGARQVGKSTLIRDFGKQYAHYIEFNLERPNDRRIFESEKEITELWQQIIFDKNLPDDPTQTLLFIDEIQEIPHVIKQLRYFYEQIPQLHVIAAGSLLEFSLGDVRSFPVGRVEEMTLHPFDFEEFLLAIGEKRAYDELQKIPIPTYAYDKLFELFKQYIIIGGMPEVIKRYVESERKLAGLKDVYASIWGTYQSDVVKYARNPTESQVMRFVINAAPMMRDRVSFAGFGGSTYRSREVGEALRALDQARVIYLIYPTTQTAPPYLADLSRRPRLQFLDTGLMNYASGIQAELMQLDDLNDYYKGFVVNHCITQELIANPDEGFQKPHFWVKENTNTNAEVDLTFKWGKYLLPLEVKSGAKGSLKSLHEFMDQTDHALAIRFLKNQVSLEATTTRKQKNFYLLNLPYFAASQLGKYVEWAMPQVE
jgi:uncharacterized protein